MAKISKLSRVKKRGGELVPFSPRKIKEAIWNAAQSVAGKDKDLAYSIGQEVVKSLQSKYPGAVPSVEDIQDVVEKSLVEGGHYRTAKAYILFRHEREKERTEQEFVLGESFKESNLNFSTYALEVLKGRCLLKDHSGTVIETPQKLLKRVSKAVAGAEKEYGSKSTRKTEAEFYDMMKNLQFLPGSPLLSNAGTQMNQLSSCLVLPIEDSISGIFGTLQTAALVNKNGGGTGFSFTRLRGKRGVVAGGADTAAGPLAFMDVFDSSANAIKQGGRRKGANMGILRIDHPDIFDFISSKNRPGRLSNFNISVAITDAFMKAVLKDGKFNLLDPNTKKKLREVRAKDLFDLIVHSAWLTGDPGIVFIDQINNKHPCKHLGELEATSPCGEVPLLPNESCNLGSINLVSMVKADWSDLDWSLLRQTVQKAVRFLDNSLDSASYASHDIEFATKSTRKIGLGIFGFADMLYMLGIKYDSKKGLAMAEKLMKYIKDTAYNTSEILAKERGTFPAWEGSLHHKNKRRMRNATCIAIAPTGTISILADVSSGCEPNFAISYVMTVLDNSRFVYTNPIFEKIAMDQGFYSPSLMAEIAKIGSIQNFKDIPKNIKNVFVTSLDISPEWHIKVQAALQKYVDNSVSKTANLANTATLKQISDTLILAWKSGCKGITVYREGSHPHQVISTGERR